MGCARAIPIKIFIFIATYSLALGAPVRVLGQASPAAGGGAAFAPGKTTPNSAGSNGFAVAAASDPSTIGEVLASDAVVKGSITMAGSGISVMSGASITAVKGAATLRLRRGGEVRVCAPTTLTITSSKNERELLMSINVGSMETHYTRPAGADSIVTPDFRFLLAGPGTFHFALSADIRGNTCLRTLPGNSSSIIVSELSGEGVYQLRPQDLVVFREGHMSDSSAQALAGCGCAAAPAAVTPVVGSSSPGGVPGAVTGTGLEANAGPAPVTRPGETLVEVDVPFVFRGGAPAEDSPAVNSSLPGGGMKNRGAPAKLMSAGGMKPVPCELLSPLLPAWECRAMVALNRPPARIPNPELSNAGSANHRGNSASGLAKGVSRAKAAAPAPKSKNTRTGKKKKHGKTVSAAKPRVSNGAGKPKKALAKPLDLKRFGPLTLP